jgi:POT family proton-dependent oligopeptide transporter
LEEFCGTGRGVSSQAPSRNPADDRFPPQIKYIISNEACERFSFYGMRSILTLYIAKHLGMGASSASEIVHLFVFGVYFMPLFGAWVSDRILGRYKTILFISLFYCLGHGVLALADLVQTIEAKKWLLYGGLALISIGGGGIKPCVSAFVGDQFREGQSHLLQKAYGLFYWSINFGSFFSFLLIPRIAKDSGYGWAFGVPGLFMALATLVFWLGRKHYQHVPPARDSKGGFWEMLWHALTHLGDRRSGGGFWSSCEGKFTAEEVAGARAATRVAGVFALIPFFWALWDQNSTTWVLQGDKMTPYVFSPGLLQAPVMGPIIRFIIGDRIAAEQMQSMNALFVMLMVPLFTCLIFPITEKSGTRVTTLRRIGTGLFLTASSFLMISFIEQKVAGGEKLNVLWQTIPYLFLTAGEVLVSNTGLEFAYREAPQAMRSTMMSFFLLTTAIGNLAISKVFGLNVKQRLADGTEILHVTGVDFFNLCAGSLFVVGIAFVFVAIRYTYRADQSSSKSPAH